MILLGIIIVGAFIAGWAYDGPLIGLLLGFIAMFLLGLFMLIPTAIYGDYMVDHADQYEITEVSQENIYALQDKGELHGSFFLGSGTVDEQNYYFYITEGPMGKSIEQKSIDYCFIDDSLAVDEQPYMSKVIIESDNFFAKTCLFTNRVDVYIFHIPKGSIIENYRIDLE
jgi:hypothetical protein